MKSQTPAGQPASRQVHRLMHLVRTPRLLDLFPVTMSIYDDQHKTDQPAPQQNENNWLVMPNLDHKAGEITEHPGLIYTIRRQSPNIV